MVVFLILHYIVDEVTETCVDSILNLKGDKKVLIVDNKSPNNSYEKLKAYYKDNNDVILIQNNDNLGFAKGNNAGYDYIKKHIRNVKFIVAMNNDMKIEQNDFIEKIHNSYIEDKFYVLAPDVFSVQKGIHQNPEALDNEIKDISKIDNMIKSISGKKMIKNRIKGILRRIKPLVKLVYNIKRKKRNTDKRYLEKQYNCTFHGSCLIFSELFIKERAYCFYPKTRFYCESQILEYECAKNNWLRVYNPDMHVLHYEDISTNARYKSYLKRLKFQNECLIESLEEFKKLILEDNK